MSNIVCQSLETARVTGSYSLEDFQLALPEYHSKDILKVLEALGVCIQVNINIICYLPINPFTNKMIFSARPSPTLSTSSDATTFWIDWMDSGTGRTPGTWEDSTPELSSKLDLMQNISSLSCFQGYR